MNAKRVFLVSSKLSYDSFKLHGLRYNKRAFQ